MEDIVQHPHPIPRPIPHTNLFSLLRPTAEPAPEIGPEDIHFEDDAAFEVPFDEQLRESIAVGLQRMMRNEAYIESDSESESAVRPESEEETSSEEDERADERREYFR